MHTLRTRFANEIVTEFLPPRKKSRRVVILCGGMPSIPAKKAVIEYFAKNNFWVFFPRYRGTWESDGKFLKRSPHEDVIDIINGLSDGFVSYWDHESYRVQPEEIYIIGASFGGPAAILASKDERVTAAVAVSPVIDWQHESEDEPLDFLKTFVREGFGNGYRFEDAEWNKLAEGNFYNPAAQVSSIDGSKIFIMHSLDDRAAPYEASHDFSLKTGAKLWTLKKYGHLGLSFATRFVPFMRIKHFFRSVR
ncbi:MAG: alpha/beta hydrolase family protein [Patescibacteria group bacterium]